MFFRLALPGARRVLLDHIAFARRHLPQWNPLSVVGQHMQQAGATPAEAMGLTLSSAIQYASDCLARGWDPDQFLPRFTFFFDISISFFEEVAKFRAGRRIWARLTRERFGAKDPRSWRFKFHGQTSGVDLTREQPLNNIARVTVQAMAGIFGGLQSLHTDAYDEVLSVPTEKARAHRHRDAEHPEGGGAPDRRDRSARRLLLRRGADRPDGGQDPRGDRTHRRGRRHVRGGGGGPGAADLRRLGAGLPGEGRSRARRPSSASTSTACRPRRRWSARRSKPPPRKKIEAQLKRLKRFKAEREQGEVRAGARRARARRREPGRERVREGGRGRLRRRHARRDLRRAARGLRLRPTR